MSDEPITTKKKTHGKRRRSIRRKDVPLAETEASGADIKPVEEAKEESGKEVIDKTVQLTSKIVIRDPEPPTKRDLFVAVPMYKFTNPATTWTLVAIALDLGKEHARFDAEFGDAMIYHARNKLAKRFLDSDSEWCVWIDDDIIPPIGRENWFRWVGNLPREDFSDTLCGQHFISRLLQHGKTIVGATYFGRQATGTVTSSAAMNPSQNPVARSGYNQLLPVEWVGTGCMIVHRKVFEDIQNKFPELAPTTHRPWWDFFVPMSGEGSAGEDVAFCKRAAAAGHQVYLDAGLQCLHVGWACYGKHNTGNRPVVSVKY
jgi:hypothetical protein